MHDRLIVTGIGLVAVTGLIVMVAVLAAGLMQAGQRRAALIAGALPLALLLPTIASSVGSFRLMRVFGAMAQAGTGTAEIIVDTCRSIWWLERAGYGALALVSLVGLLVGLLRTGPTPEGPECSARRGFVLLLMPTLALMLAAGLGREARSALRISHAVVQDTQDPARKAAVEAVLESEGLGGAEGGAGIARTVERVATAGLLSTYGGLAALVVLTGLGITGTILAWPVRVGALFVAASSTLWSCVFIASSALALGAGDPLRLG